MSDQDVRTHEKLDALLALLGSATLTVQGEVRDVPNFYPSADSATKPALDFAAAGAVVGTVGIVIKGAPGRVYFAHVMNASGAVVYAMLFNSPNAPVNGDTPVMTIPLGATSGVQTFTIPGGRYFNAGIGIAFSSTASTLTLVVANGQKYSIGYR